MPFSKKIEQSTVFLWDNSKHVEIWGANPFVRAVVILPSNTNTVTVSVTGNRDKTTSKILRIKIIILNLILFKLLALPLVCLEVL